MTTVPVLFCHQKAAVLTHEHPGCGKTNQLTGDMARRGNATSRTTGW